MENSTKVYSSVEKNTRKRFSISRYDEIDVKEEEKLNKLLKSDMTAWWATGN
jgi:hypothetical protein